MMLKKGFGIGTNTSYELGKQEDCEERDDGVVETDGLDGEGSRAEQIEIEGSKAKEESTKEEQWRGKRMRSER
ncbi:hypothetical protein NPIL_283251 [Nephila pilipes]|uniref:Uncharacterized protein n=1 Tax=Nephila pilipes TaxID=299642 RepID=A0A8X6PJJ8_NEPPI|nr:hypothetical protein NPIL_283251 [Nephila pilipes]